MKKRWVWVVVLAAGVGAGADTPADKMPATAGETLSGKRIVLAEAVKGQMVVLVAGFSRKAGDGCGAWVKALRADKALAGARVYDIAELEDAPGMLRGMIKSGIRKGVAEAEHDWFVVLTADDKAWRSYFQVGDDQVPYVMVVGENGAVAWRGHGQADTEPQVRAAIK